jgi:hypothetical protein
VPFEQDEIRFIIMGWLLMHSWRAKSSTAYRTDCPASPKKKQGSVKVVSEHIVWLFLTPHEVVAGRGLVHRVPLTA